MNPGVPEETGSLSSSDKEKFGLGKDFLLVWSGQTVSIIGDSIGGMGLYLLILDRTGSATALSLGLVVQLVPALMLGPVAGVVLDRLDRRKSMIACDISRGILTLLLALSALTERFVLAYAYLWLLSNAIFRAFYEPATMAVIPALVPSGSIQRANAMQTTGRYTGSVVGPVLAGVIYSALGPSWCLAIDAVTFWVAACCIGLAGLRFEERKVVRGRFSFSEMREGFIFFRKVRLAMILLVLTILCNFFMIPAGTALQFHIVRTLGYDPKLLGVTTSATAAASIVASIVLMTKKRWPHLGYMIALGVAGIGASYAMTSGVRNPLALPVVWSISGLMGPVLQVPISTLYQEITPSEVRGRVFSLRTALSTALAPVSALAGGFLIDLYGSRVVLLGLGVGLVMTGTCVSAFPEIRKA